MEIRGIWQSSGRVGVGRQWRYVEYGFDRSKKGREGQKVILCPIVRALVGGVGGGYM